MSDDSTQQSLERLRTQFAREQAVATKTRDRAAAAAALAEAAECLRDIPVETIRGYHDAPMPLALRLLFLALRGDGLGAVYAHTTVRGPRSLTEVRYLADSTPSEEAFFLDGHAVTPVSVKWRRIDYFGQELVRERIAWLPGQGKAAVRVDGVTAVMGHRTYPYKADAPVPEPPAAPVPVSPRPPVSGPRPTAPSATPAPAGPLARLFGRAAPARPSSEHAWLLMDRVGHAGDNAEHLFHYLRTRRPDINAWFVIAPGTPDAARLARITDRVIDYGSAAHRAALAGADIVASSYLDQEMTHPIPDREYAGGVRPWRFVYLQHGILHTDLSLWFNTKPIDLMTMACEAEWHAVVDDDSPYLLTDAVAKLTGFPRFDSLVARARRTRRRNLIVIAPTWRLDLVGAKDGDSERPPRDGFEESEFARQWFGLARHPRLARLAQAAKASIVFQPHPSMRRWMHLFPDLADITFVGADVPAEKILPRTRLLITDYSSVAFDAAVCGSEIIYFQFDRASVLGGSHTSLPGVFDFERDGLGPVVTTADELIDAAAAGLRAPSRIAGTDGEHRPWAAQLADGRSAERITRQIEDLLG